MEIIRCNWTRNVNKSCLHCFSTASSVMNMLWEGLCSLQMLRSRVLPLPCSISFQKFLEFLFTDATSAKVLDFFPRQKRGSSRSCKSIPRYPHDSRMSHKVMHDLHDRDCSRARDIQHMYPQTHSLHGLWDVWQRPRDTQVLYESQEYTTICDGLPGIRIWPLRVGNLRALFAPLRKIHT